MTAPQGLLFKVSDNKERPLFTILADHAVVAIEYFENENETAQFERVLSMVEQVLGCESVSCSGILLASDGSRYVVLRPLR